MYLHFIIGNDNSTTNFQQNPSLFLQNCVSLLWGFCMWLGFVGPYSSSRMVHLHYICICSCMVAHTNRFFDAVDKLSKQCGTPLLRHSTVYVIGSHRKFNQFGERIPKHLLDLRCRLPT
ncbi:hypothetical protein ACB092_11G159700 [Castanea dentata]